VKVAAALARARAEGLERLDAQLLLAHLLGRERGWLIAHDDAPLEPALQAAYAALCRRRLDDEPLAYLVGEREFHGLQLRVNPAVLVPRPETEILVDRALGLLRERPTASSGPEVVDLGTGSGAIALAVKARCPEARVTGVDSSAEALAVARANGSRLQLAVEWLAGDWWQPLAGRCFDLVLANPPYIAPGDPHLRALRHEPTRALVAPAGGLGEIDRIVGGAGAHLAAGGWLLLEHGFDQAPAVRSRLQAAGFAALFTEPDLAGLPRCSGGRWPGPAAASGDRQRGTDDAEPGR
jgi:release factor glutamine methyltransferase